MSRSSLLKGCVEAQNQKSLKLETKVIEGKLKLTAAEKANIEKWVESNVNQSCKQMSKTFNDEMKLYKDPKKTTDTCMKFETKNRYRDVMCIDDTRVVLKNRPKDDDYIHANWMSIPDGTKYICTQGPLEETREDFWEMIMQEKVPIILMLCNFTEGENYEKCTQYFPTKIGEKTKYGKYTILSTVEVKDLKDYEGITVTKLTVKKDRESLTVLHVLMTSWQDNMAPTTGRSVIALWRWVKKNANNKPVVVHCSAGVGRTSTFVGFELAIYRIADNPECRILDVIKELRSSRYQSVQSHVQYLFLHIALFEFFESEKIAKLPKGQAFIDEYRKHVQKKMKKRAKATG